MLVLGFTQPVAIGQVEAQHTEEAEPCKQLVASSTAAPSPNQVVIPKGQKIVVSNLHAISSANAEVGNRYEFETAETVRVGGLVVIPAHLPLLATAGKLSREGHGHSAKLELSFGELRLCSGDIIGSGNPKDYKGGNVGRAIGDAIGSAAGLSLTPLSPLAGPLLLSYPFRRGQPVFIDKATRHTLVTQVDVPISAAFFAQHQPPAYSGPPVVFYRPARRYLSLLEGTRVLIGDQGKIILPPGKYTFRVSKKKSGTLELSLGAGDIVSLVGYPDGPRVEQIDHPIDLLADKTDYWVRDFTSAAEKGCR
jgi:hypothetical protein